jgi:type II secretory pathway pseudopilin PulG
MASFMLSGRQSARGFAYLLLLIAVAVIGLAATASVSLGAQMARRDAERQLLAIGLEFQNALRSYAGVAPGSTIANAARGPRTLEELLKDPRTPAIRRHLRQHYDDPLTGKAEWGLVVDSGGFIVGIYSLAEGRPIRQEGFEPTQSGFDNASSYRQWVFGLSVAQLPGVVALQK